MALGINAEKTIAWIEEFPLSHFFTTKRFGNVARKYGPIDATRLEAEIQRFVGKEYSRIHLIPHGKDICFMDADKSFQGNPSAQGVILRRNPEFTYVLTLYPADCYPILLTDSRYKIIGLLHGSWKQLKQKIIERAIALIQTETKLDPQSIIVGIGPGIKKCCYHKDLLAMILKQVDKYKIEKVFIAGTCTYCTKLEGEEDYLFFSHRRSKVLPEPEGRFAAVLTSQLIGSG